MNRCAPLVALVAATALALPAAAQSPRPFPKTALRGELQFGPPPEVAINGQPARLAPGARIRGENNMLLMSGAIVGAKAVVHYTLDPTGLVKDVWVLTPDELANKPWPSTPQEAATWTFNPDAQRWSK